MQTTLIKAAEISPNGAYVLYETSQWSVRENAVHDRWLLQTIPDARQPVKPAIILPEGASAVTWLPDGRHVSFIINASTTHVQTFQIFDILTKRSRAIQAPIGTDYQWSSQGAFLIFTRSVASNNHRALFLLDPATEHLTQLTSNNLNVARIGGFSCSPDERFIAVTIDRQEDSQGTDTDLAIIEVHNGKMRWIIRRPGTDGAPLWSPDGRWISFFTDDGNPSYLGALPAAVSIASGKIIAFSSSQAPRGWYPLVYHASAWTPDNGAFLFEGERAMATQLFRVNIAKKTIDVLPLPAGPNQGKAFDEHRSFSADLRREAYVRSSSTNPQDLYVTELDKKQRPIGQPRQLTFFGNTFPFRDRVRSQIINWPSADKKFSIHGILLLPNSASRAIRLKYPLPTALYLDGGPTMVRRAFPIYFELSALALAIHGYAVLIPNTRGRGGYGETFLSAIRDEHSYMRLPYNDALSGVRYLVRRGIADPKRLAVLGHSYGGTLTEYAITQTGCFRAAVIHEAGSLDFTQRMYPPAPGTWHALIARDLFGIRDALSRTDRTTLFDESPGLHARNASTPTLLLFGANSAAKAVGEPFLRTLQAVHVPSSLITYQEGHNFEHPGDLADSLTRTLNWLDYWESSGGI